MVLPVASCAPDFSRPLHWGLAAVAVLAIGAAVLAVRDGDDKGSGAPGPSTARPALTVTVTQPQRATLPVTVAANGSVAPWQEASVGTEANGLRLAEVRVNVGDRVRRGQVLATFAADLLRADLAQIEAAVAEAEAVLAEAGVNAQRARELQASGALSAQQIQQYLTAERTAAARLDAQRAAARLQQLRLAQTRVTAADDGVISSRSATVGAVLPAGQELFRLIRQGRLEWRAEVAAADLAQIKPGQAAHITPVGAAPLTGRVRMVAPTIDAGTRNGLVYVDLPPPSARGDGLLAGGVRAGMFARGEFQIGSSEALTLPQAAVLPRDGFSHVFRLEPQARVRQARVEIGRRGGLVTSTFLSLLVIPVVYTFVDDAVQAVTRRFGRRAGKLAAGAGTETAA